MAQKMQHKFYFLIWENGHQPHPPGRHQERMGPPVPAVRTHVRPLGHVGVIGLMQELRRVVINVLDLDNEL